MTKPEIRARQRAALGRMPRKEIHAILKMARNELAARWQVDEALKKWKTEGYRGLANFMAGVTWALACRTALRDSKGHNPVGGKKPQSGEMWLPRELLYAVRHQVKDRGWHPITAENWGKVKENLLAEARTARVPPGTDRNLHAVQFAVKMVRQEARAIIDLDERFDRSGAV